MHALHTFRPCLLIGDDGYQIQNNIASTEIITSVELHKKKTIIA